MYVIVEEPGSVLGFGFWKLRAQLYTSYFECWGSPDNCMGGNFLKSVGILWAAIWHPVLLSQNLKHPIWAQNNTGCKWQPIIFPSIWKNAAPNSHQDHLSNQNIQVLVGPLTLQLSPLITHFFLVWLLDYKEGGVKKFSCRPPPYYFFFWIALTFIFMFAKLPSKYHFVHSFKSRIFWRAAGEPKILIPLHPCNAERHRPVEIQ